MSTLHALLQLASGNHLVLHAHRCIGYLVLRPVALRGSSNMSATGNIPPRHLSFAADAVSPGDEPSSMRDLPLRNWASTHAWTPKRTVEPGSVGEVVRVITNVRAVGRTLRVVGSLHSPNACCMGSEVVVSLRRMNRVLEIDTQNQLVKVEAGILVSELNAELHAKGLALDNLGSISDQTLAGMISTGTHGTGIAKQTLAACVVELQIVTPDGSVTVCSALHQSGERDRRICWSVALTHC